MKRSTDWLVIGLCTALIGFGFASVANAQNTGDRSTFTVTEPLDVGGTILQPGTYQIRIVPEQRGRNILQVWSADATQLLTTVLSVPHHVGPEGLPDLDSSFVYYPASADSIKALRTWYAADTPAGGGHDIVYPRKRAMELAALATEPVVAIPDEVQVAELETTPLLVVTPKNEIRPYEVATLQEPPAKLAQNTPRHELLPQTASRLPLVAGLGFLSLVGALGLGVLARRFV